PLGPIEEVLLVGAVGDGPAVQHFIGPATLAVEQAFEDRPRRLILLAVVAFGEGVAEDEDPPGTGRLGVIPLRAPQPPGVEAEQDLEFLAVYPLLRARRLVPAQDGMVTADGKGPRLPTAPGDSPLHGAAGSRFDEEQADDERAGRQRDVRQDRPGATHEALP